MKLVVDANILFSFFKKDSITRRLLTSFEIFELYTPSLCFVELINHKEEICKKSKISESDFNEILDDLKLFVETIPDEKFKDYGLESKKILPAHLKDAPYVALCLFFRSAGYNIALWTNEVQLKKLKNQGITVYSTKDLLELLKLI